MEPATRAMPANAPAERTVRVWDPLVRVLHWSLVAGVALAWMTAEGGRAAHEVIGYAVTAAVALRVAWGFVGPRHARFASFVRGPRPVLDYTQGMARGRAPRYLGHNPLGGWMIVALLTLLGAVAVSGWLLGSDAWFGDERVEDLHEALAQALLWLVALHVGGVLFAGWQHGENLVRAMLDGRKRAVASGDVD